MNFRGLGRFHSGRRFDGRSISEYENPIVRFAPFIISACNDAQNFVIYPVGIRPVADESPSAARRYGA